MSTTVPFNIAQNHRYKFALQRAPAVSFFMKEVSIPGISLPQAILPTPFHQIPLPGEHLDFQPFSFTFIVDEEFQNYDEIWKWVVGLGTSFEAFSPLKKAPVMSAEREVSDGTLVIQSNKINPRMEVHFEDMWPTDVGELTFSTDTNDVQYATCAVTVNYKSYSYKITK